MYWSWFTHILGVQRRCRGRRARQTSNPFILNFKWGLCIINILVTSLHKGQENIRFEVSSLIALELVTCPWHTNPEPLHSPWPLESCHHTRNLEHILEILLLGILGHPSSWALPGYVQPSLGWKHQVPIPGTSEESPDREAWAKSAALKPLICCAQTKVIQIHKSTALESP